MVGSLYVNIQVIVFLIIAWILCGILLIVVFPQTIRILCIHKLCFILYGSNDEANLATFAYNKSTPDNDIHFYFRVTSIISMSFCVLSSITSVISITHLIINDKSLNLFILRGICFISWLMSGYSMSFVFLGRLYVSFKGSVFQYPLHIIRLLSVTLILLPLLLLISFIFYLIHHISISYIFLIIFMFINVLFGIILTVLFIHKLYQLIRNRIEANASRINLPKELALKLKNSAKSKSKSKANAHFSFEKQNKNNILKEENEFAENEENDVQDHTIIELQTTNSKAIATNDITPYLGSIKPFTPQMKMPVTSRSGSQLNENIPDLTLNMNNGVSSASIQSPGSHSHTGTCTDIRISEILHEEYINDNHPELHDIDHKTKTKTVLPNAISPQFGRVYSNSFVASDNAPQKMDTDIGIQHDKVQPKTDTNITKSAIRIVEDNPTFTSDTSTTNIQTRTRSDSLAKRAVRFVSTGISPRSSLAFQKAKKELDEHQVKLIGQMIRHGLLLFFSSLTSLSCVIYIMYNAEYYEMEYIDVNNYHIKILHYYLYWYIGISSFLNGLSLFLTFRFAYWMYNCCCNKIHKWLEANCILIIVRINIYKQK